MLPGSNFRGEAVNFLGFDDALCFVQGRTSMGGVLAFSGMTEPPSWLQKPQELEGEMESLPPPKTFLCLPGVDTLFLSVGRNGR